VRQLPVTVFYAGLRQTRRVRAAMSCGAWPIVTRMDLRSGATGAERSPVNWPPTGPAASGVRAPRGVTATAVTESFIYAHAGRCEDYLALSRRLMLPEQPKTGEPSRPGDAVIAPIADNQGRMSRDAGR